MKDVEIMLRGKCSDNVFQKICECINEIMEQRKEMSVWVMSEKKGAGQGNRTLEFNITEKGADE